MKILLVVPLRFHLVVFLALKVSNVQKLTPDSLDLSLFYLLRADRTQLRYMAALGLNLAQLAHLLSKLQGQTTILFN